MMEILYLLIPLSVLLVFLIGALFWWSVRSGQYDVNLGMLEGDQSHLIFHPRAALFAHGFEY